MERGEPSLKPEWLLRGPSTVAATAARPVTSSRADDQGKGASSRNRSTGRDRDRGSQQSSSRRGLGSSASKRNDRDGAGKSRGYASFGRHNRERGQEKDPDFRERESRLVQPEDPLRDGFESFSSCRPEKDRLNRTRSKTGISNRAGVSLENGNVSKKDSGTISFEREFPHLGSDDKNGKQDIGRVPSPGINNPIHSIPLVAALDGWNSALAEVPIPILGDSSNNSVSSSSSTAGLSKQTEVSNSGSALSMAETVMQSPLKISTAPQLSIDAQKIEERTMRQCILRPLTPSSSKNSVSSSFDKLKPKAVRAGEANVPVKVAPHFSVQPSSSSVRTPVKAELVKPTQSGSLQVLSREQNGTVNTAKDTINNPLGPVLGRSSSMEPMRKPVNQKLKVVTNGLPLHKQGSFGERKSSAKDKHKFFEFLRSKSVNGSSTAIDSPSSLVDDQQNSCPDLSLYNSGVKFLENGSSSCEEANSCEGSRRQLSDNEEVITIPSESHEILDEGSLGIPLDNGGVSSSSAIGDMEDFASKNPQPDIPAYTDGVSMMSNSVNKEAKLLFGTADGEESYPAQELEHIGAGEEETYAAEELEHTGEESSPDEPSPEERVFLRSLGWDENEVVPPLLQEEIADCIRQNVRLQQKLQECRG